MASAGELVIKIAADYASLVTGMSEAGAKVDAFGNKIQAQTSQMARGFSAAATAIKAFIGYLAVEKIVGYGEALQKTVGDMADMAENLKLTVDEFQAFEGAAYLAGQRTEAVATALGKFNVFIGKASEGSKEQVERLNDLGIKILDVNGKLRPQADLLQEVATKLIRMEEGAKRAASEVAFFGKSGQAVSGILSEWAKGVSATNAELERMGLKHSPEVVRQLDELDKKAAIAAKQMEVFFAPFYAATKAKLFEHFSEILKAFISDLDAIGAHANIIDKIIALLQAFGKDGSAASAAAFSTEQYAKATERLTTSIEHLEKAQDNLRRTSRPGVPNPALDAISERLNAEREQLRLLRSPNGPGETGGAGQYTPNKPPGASNPGVKGAGDSVLEDIRKLEDIARVANNAIQRMGSKREEDLESVKRNIEQQRDIDLKVGELMRKAEAAGVGGQYAARINEAARAAVEGAAGWKLYEADVTAADAATRKLDDGTADLARTTRELNRQKATGRLSEVAYGRAIYDATEKMKDQAAEVARFKGGLEAMGAGFEKAARDYAKANDEFAMGAKVFNGFIGVMDQSLDVLMGTSNKTFEQIAADFGRMLAKMALQAAISPVFKWIMGSVSGMGGGDVPGIPTPSGSDDSGAAGGGVLSWLGSIFGGARAIGGDVQPGMSYNVGEHGPERFTPTGAGTITPYSGRDGGGVTVNLDMKQAAGARDPQAALDFGRKVKAAVTDIITTEKRPGGLLYGG